MGVAKKQGRRATHQANADQRPSGLAQRDWQTPTLTFSFFLWVLSRCRVTRRTASSEKGPELQFLGGRLRASEDVKTARQTAINANGLGRDRVLQANHQVMRRSRPAAVQTLSDPRAHPDVASSLSDVFAKQLYHGMIRLSQDGRVRSGERFAPLTLGYAGAPIPPSSLLPITNSCTASS